MINRFMDFMSSAVVRGLVLERPIWSWVMVLGAVSRSLSYWFRPPNQETISPASSRIEGALSYEMWTIGLMTYAVLIAVGTLLRRDQIAWLGHLLGLGAVATLALSVFSSAAFDGAGWSAVWPLVVVCLVHYGRLNALGPKVADRAKRKVRKEPRS